MEALRDNREESVIFMVDSNVVETRMYPDG